MGHLTFPISFSLHYFLFPFSLQPIDPLPFLCSILSYTDGCLLPASHLSYIYYLFTSLIAHLSPQWGQNRLTTFFFLPFYPHSHSRRCVGWKYVIGSAGLWAFIASWGFKLLSPWTLNHYTTLALMGWLLLNSSKQPDMGEPCSPMVSSHLVVVAGPGLNDSSLKGQRSPAFYLQKLTSLAFSGFLAMATEGINYLDLQFSSFIILGFFQIPQFFKKLFF